MGGVQPAHAVTVARAQALPTFCISREMIFEEREAEIVVPPERERAGRSSRLSCHARRALSC